MTARTTSFQSMAYSRGFTLVEVMVAVAIAVFLLAGLITIVQNLRSAYLNQTGLTQLQDEERFAFTVLTDAIQAGGYYGDPNTQSSSSFVAAGGFVAGAAFAGSHLSGVADAAAQDTIATRFMTSPNYGPILCNGVDTSQAGPGVYSIQFSVAPGTDGTNQLMCAVNGGGAFPLINGVQAMAVYYGIKRANVGVDDNVDTYVTWDLMGGTDFQQISSVRIVLTFVNPLYPAPSQPQFITTERVIEVMGRAGEQA
jgi:type IV pilus assembly protein PilW